MSGRSKDVAAAYKGVAVTPTNNTAIPPTRALYIGGTGDVVVKFVDNGDPTVAGGTVTLSSVAAGTILPVQVNCVNATNTTATLIVALY